MIAKVSLLVFSSAAAFKNDASRDKDARYRKLVLS